MLTSGELSIMRAAINQLMPDTCGIISYTALADGEGWQTQTASGTVTANCRLDQKSGWEKNAAGAMVPFTKWVLSLPYDTAITEQNRVTHGGYTYNVMSVNTDASWIGVKRAQLERVP